MKEAGVGTRVINFLVDTFLIFLLSFGLFKWYSFYVMYWEYTYFPFYIFFDATIVIYYTVFELIWSRTPGKWLSMSKVRNVAGGRPKWYQVVLRSILRLTIIDCFFIPFLDRTLHDALSKTRVVEA
ncbi:RDD family protein [Segetibacter koreensis]|uniref:RDD family protein n=1 Tax=Segetibacter koreensis TaxID=398037 RepID=UPI000374D8BD|nr:RDD family protein [Segetibacter koreensis]